MKIEQKEWNASTQWVDVSDNDLTNEAQLVLAFGCKQVLQHPERFDEIRAFYPNADIMVSSTAGEIIEERICDESINVTAISFQSTNVKAINVRVTEGKDTYEAGAELIKSLQGKDLGYALIISDGQIAVGSELTRALRDNHLDNVAVTGGLAGDGPRFENTLVGLNEAPSEGTIVGIGFYGNNLKVGHAARGGWDPFGPERIITRSEGNVLYELDGQSALDLYKKYLGELADDLPGSALLFPLGVQLEEGGDRIVRTILGVDEETQSMTFAGDVPEGARARMMKSNFDRLIDSATHAADTSVADFGSFEPDLAIIISCAGRRFVLQDRVGEEVEKVREVLGDQTIISGFYAYGEISPVVKSTKCELHNQTMTITTLKEEVLNG